MVARPPLPTRYANAKISFDRHLPPVKYQILNCQGKDILVGRLKVETPTDTGHAFILRRFDTQAISLTTMFRAAFPNAPESDEKAEINWVRENYDLSGNNGSTKDMHITRLAGTWVSPAVALQLGEDYGLGALMNVVVEAKPDPSANYRRSGKAAANNNSATAVAAPASQAPPPYATTAQSATVTRELSSEATLVAEPVFSKPPPASTSLPTPSPPSANPPSKRRKASSPASASASPRPSRIPALASPAPTPVTDRVIAPLRRSARTSPAPTTRSLAATTVNRTPKVGRSAVAKKESSSTVTVSVSSAASTGALTVVDEETMAIEDGIIGSGLHEEDMAEQQKLLQEMTKKREAANEEVEDELVHDPTGKTPLVRRVSKRRAEELAAQPDRGVLVYYPGQAAEDRVIATNKRIKAQKKSLIWGVAAFAVGVGAMFLPNFL